MKYIKIDKLGRIVIPISYRKILNINTDTPLKLDCNGRKITITPTNARCVLCNKTLDTDTVLPLCKECINEIRKSTPTDD